jgi:hypothetical protein
VQQKEIEEILKKDLFKELGLDDLSLEEKMGLAEDMGRIIIQGLWLRILENMSLEKQEELAQIVEKGESEEEIMNFLKKEVPNLEDLVKEEIAKYKSLLISEVNK